MKTTLKTFLCLALTTIAIPAFAAPVLNGSTTLAFKDACGGNLVTSVGLNGAGTPDVYIETTTTSSLGQPYIDQGKVQLQIAVDVLGNPTSVALVDHWVRIDGAGPGTNPSSGVACFPVDLDGLSSLGIGVNDVTCSTPLVGFRAHYVTGGGATHVDTHFSNAADLTINCSACGTSTSLTIGIKLTSGQGSPTPGTCGDWTYRITVQNCTGYDLTGVKVQGGTAGWVNTASAIADLSPAATIKLNNKNQVITWIGNLVNGQSVNIDVTVHGCLKNSQVCSPCDQLDTPVAGSVLYLSGPWSAAYTDPVTLLPAKTDYTGRVSLTTACLVCP